MKLRGLLLGRKAMTNLDSVFKKQRHYFTNKGLSLQSYSFSISHVWMRELDNKKGWTLNNWCLRIVMLGKTLPSPLDSTQIKPVNPKENQYQIFFGRIDAEAPILWPPDMKSQLIGEDPDDWKNWRQEEKGMTGLDLRIVSLTKWQWIWANSGRWWRTGKLGMLQSMGSQKVGQD